MFPTNQRKTILLLGLSALVLLASSSKGQSIYRAVQDASSFGWLDQFSLNSAAYNYVGPQACVPTSSVNVMTYLQNVAPSYFGTSLTGSTYGDWISADTTLISPAYMNTSPTTGTAFNRLPFALNEYVVQDYGFTGVQILGMIPDSVWTASPAPEPRPSTIVDSLPTWSYLFGALNSNSGTVLGMTYSSFSGGHAVSLGGFDWTDLNANSRIDYDEAAVLSFVDPLDPTRGADPIGGAKFTTGRIWEDQVPNPTNSSLVYNTLVLQYDQYQGSALWGSPADYGSTTAYLTTAVSITVPEPSSCALLALGTLGLLLFFRRKMAA